MSNRHGAYEGPLFSYLERPEPIRSRLWRRANFALTEFYEVRPLEYLPPSSSVAHESDLDHVGVIARFSGHLEG